MKLQVNRSFTFHLNGLLRFVIGVLILGVVLWLSGYRLDLNSGNNEWLSYRSATYGYEIEYPSGWRIFTFGAGGNRNHREERLRLTNGLFPPKGTITIQQRAVRNLDVEDVAEWGYDLMVEDYGIKRSTLEDMQYSNHLYLTRIYQAGDVTIHDVYIPRTGDALILRMISSSDELSGMLPLFQEVVLRFQSDMTLE